MALSYWHMGDLRRLQEAGKYLLEYGIEHANIRSQTIGHMAFGGAYQLKGDYPRQIECFQKALNVSADTMYSMFAMTLLGLGYLLNEQIQEAEECLAESYAFSEEYGFDWMGIPAKLLLGAVLIAKGSLSKGFTLIDEAYQSFMKEERRYYQALTDYMLGKIYAQIANGTGSIKPLHAVKNIGFILKQVPFADKKAEAHFKKSIKIAETIGAMNVLGQAYLEWGLLHKGKKRKEKAKACLTKAYENFEQCEAEQLLKKAETALASL